MLESLQHSQHMDKANISLHSMNLLLSRERGNLTVASAQYWKFLCEKLEEGKILEKHKILIFFSQLFIQLEKLSKSNY